MRKDGETKRSVSPFLIGGIAAAVVGVVLIVIIAVNLTKQGYVVDQTLEPEQEEALPETRHPLTGYRTIEDVARPWVHAVMVENSRDAWPQAGLSEAFLVIEAPVEGYIPRLLAFYDATNDVSRIGPVRSARPYYVDWASQFGGIYAHVGGSPAALEQLKSADVLDLNEFSNQYQFWRDTSRYAPHNVFTSTDHLNDGFELRYEDETIPEYQFWNFKDEEPEEEWEHGPGIIVPFGQAYETTWYYQDDSNTYVRWQNEDEHPTEDREEVLANNIVIMEVDSEVLDGVGRLFIDTEGGGRAMVLQDGEVLLNATWEKGEPQDPVRLYDEAGDEIAMNPGVTWIEVIPNLDETQLIEIPE